MPRTALILALLFAAASPLLQAGELYKCKGDKGETVFSDQPCPGAEVLPMKETPTYEALPAPTMPAPVSSTKKQALSFKVHITSPQAEEVIRDNEGNVTVSATVQPGLDGIHQARLLLDGTPTGPAGGATSWQLTDVPRGEHSLVVEVIETKSGKVLTRSDSRTFALFRASANNPANPGADNLMVNPNGSLRVSWPQQQAAAQPGDPKPVAPTKPANNGPRK